MQEGRDYTTFGCCAFWRKCELGKSECIYSKSNPAKKSACGVFRNKTQILTDEVSVQATDVIEPIVEQKAEETKPLLHFNRHGQLTLF